MSNAPDTAMFPDLNLTLQHPARRYSEVAQATLDDNLTSVALFGSVARSQATPRSDIDLFVVLKAALRGALRRRALLEPVRQQLTADLEPLWERGIYTDFVEIIRSEAEARRFHPIYLDMTAAVELLHDRNGFLRDLLQNVRRRLEELGAEQRSLGSIHCWDLKPNLAVGEAIDLMNTNEGARRSLDRVTLILEEADYLTGRGVWNLVVRRSRQCVATEAVQNADWRDQPGKR